MIFSGNTVVPFSPDISVEEASVLFDDADEEVEKITAKGKENER